jgi:putative heme-binding domain-containing protein
MMFLHGEMALDKMLTVDVPPSRGAFGIENGRLISPGDPYRSVLLYRILTPSGGRMPIIGSSVVDWEGATVVRDWIASLGKAGAADGRAADLTLAARVACAEVGNGASGGGRAMAKLDRLLADTSGAMALALAAREPGVSVRVRDTLAAHAAGQALPAARDLFESFLPAAQRRKTLGPAPDPALILARQGDAEAGHRLFRSESMTQCANCHRLAGEGREFGPDLSRVGSKYGREALLEQILQPNLKVEPAWVARTVETTRDESLSGFVVADGVSAGTSDGLVLRLADGSVRRLEAREIRSNKPQALSLMPEGLLQSLTAQEAADLLEYLIRQR